MAKKSTKKKVVKKKTTKKTHEENRVVLDLQDIRVDADPNTIVSMVSALIHIPSYRKRFEANPVAHLRECGIKIPADVARKITPQSIRMTLEELKEGAEIAPAETALLPGVGVAVRVGTRPGTMPGVRVGVMVGTMTRTFAVRLEEERTGLVARQKAQRIRRENRP